MGRPADGDEKDHAKDHSRPGSDPQQRRRTRRRRRPFLNLGLPFIQVDDFLNQTDDAVAIGYRVLEETVKEIQKGYEDAKKFNRQQEAFDRGEGPAPPIPWEQIVESVQSFQDIAFRAMRNGTDIFFDSVRSGTKSVRSMAKTFEQSREDLASKPLLAGPVFDELLQVRVSRGHAPEPLKREIRHRGLARLRIQAAVDPPLTELRPIDDPSQSDLKTLKVSSVSLAPKSGNENEISELVVDIGQVPGTQVPGIYEGLIVAKNFELLIAKLRVTVYGTTQPTGPIPAPQTRRRTRAPRRRR